MKTRFCFVVGAAATGVNAYADVPRPVGLLLDSAAAFTPATSAANLDDAFPAVPIADEDLAALRTIANTELDHLEPYNCARYNLARGTTQRWIDEGRPR